MALFHPNINAQKSLNDLVSAYINSPIHLHVAVIFNWDEFKVGISFFGVLYIIHPVSM